MPPADSTSTLWFEREIKPYEALLRAWLRNRFPHEPDVDDLVQEAYLRVLRTREKRILDAPKAYLFAIARNLALDRTRARAKAESVSTSTLGELVDEGASPAEHEDQQQRIALVTEAIQALPERCRQIFTLRKVYDLSQAEIAERLGISRHTVSTQLSIGFQKCAAYVAERSATRELQP